MNIGNNTVAEGAEIATTATENAESTTTPEEKKNATQGNTGVYTHKFKKPFEYEGKKYDVINFYFDRLKGDDLLSIENEMNEEGLFAMSIEISREFLHRMAAKAGSVGADTLRALPFAEFNKITNAARRFLLTTG